jgi:ABC-type glycerol-3-phosphate transport system permease component
MTTSSRVGRTVIFLGLCLVGLTTVYPLIFMALNSLRTANEFNISPYGMPSHPSLAAYRSLITGMPFLGSLLHSTIVVVPALIIATLTSAITAFVFTKTPVKLGSAMFWAMLLIMFMPGVVVLLPLDVAISHLGLSNNFGPVILIYASLNIPYGTYLLRSTFQQVPDQVIEAARVDGAGWWRVFWQVAMPMARPGVITIGILTFLNIWNELFISIVLLNQPNTIMVQPLISELTGRLAAGNGPEVMAALFLGSLPTLAVYFISSRVFIKGMLAGAVR